MASIPAPQRCNPRSLRLAQVKFVAWSPEPEPLPPAGRLARWWDRMVRALGRLEAARP